MPKSFAQRRVVRRRFTFLVTLLAVVLAALGPRAEAAETRGIAVWAEGPGAPALRASVVKALPSGLNVADSARFRAALVAAGLVKGVGHLDKNVVRRLRAAAAAVEVEAVLVVRVVHMDPKSRVVQLTVIDAVSDLPPRNNAVLGPQPSDQDGDEVVAALDGVLDRYLPPEAPSAPADGEPANAADGMPTDDGGAAAAADAPETPHPPPVPPSPAPRDAAPLVATGVLDIAIGGEVVRRQSSYENGVARTPYVFALSAVPAARVTGNVFPFAATGTRWRALGIAFDYSFVSVTRDDIAGAKTSAGPFSYAIGLRGRFALGSSHDPRVVLGVVAEYALAFWGRGGPPTAEVPEVGYRALRPGLDVRLRFGRVSLLAGGAFRYLLDADGISSNAVGSLSGYGFDADAGAAVLLWRHLEARLFGRYERYAIALEPPAGAPLRKGSIDDAWYSARAALALLF